MNYTAELQHTKETFQRLAKIQHDEYGIMFKLAMLFLGTVSLLVAISAGSDSVISILLLLMGGLAFSGLNTPAQRNADKMVSLANGNFPHTKYAFLENDIQITSGEISTSLAYTNIYDLLEDADYYFLFLNRNAGYMIPKKTVRPADTASFAAFLEKKVGLKPHRTSGLLTLNLRARLQRNKARSQRNAAK